MARLADTASPSCCRSRAAARPHSSSSATTAWFSHCANDYCFGLDLRNGLIHRVREYAGTARGHRMVFGGLPQQ